MGPPLLPNERRRVDAGRRDVDTHVTRAGTRAHGAREASDQEDGGPIRRVRGRGVGRIDRNRARGGLDDRSVATLKHGRRQFRHIRGRQHELRGVIAALVGHGLYPGRLLATGMGVGPLGLTVTAGRAQAIARTESTHREGEGHQNRECRSAPSTTHIVLNMHVLWPSVKPFGRVVTAFNVSRTEPACGRLPWSRTRARVGDRVLGGAARQAARTEPGQSRESGEARVGSIIWRSPERR